MKTLYILTHGCQMNEYDSSKMVDLLRESHNLELTSSPEDADVVLINTCSIREKASEKVFSMLGRWRKLKEKRPNMIIGVAGCLASQEGEQIRQRAPFVDLVFGPQTLHRLPSLLNERLAKNKPSIDISFPEIEKFDHLPKPRAEGPSAYLSIMEGCSKYCSYCIVPYTRGTEVSRPLQDVLVEALALTQQNVGEIVLLGQNVNAYRGRTPDGGYADLALLLAYLSEIDAVKRLRFMTSHPLEFSDNLVEAYRSLPKLAAHCHLPVQSGSDKILMQMKRNHTVLEYKSKIKALRRARPEITISSDFIVGFPNETEADFQGTLDLVESLHFDQSYSFIYSPRPGTPAANLTDSVSLAVKKERLDRLQKLLSSQADAISHAMLGSLQSVLVLGYSERSPELLRGRTENNRMVHFEGPAELIGQLAEIEISHLGRYTLRGRWTKQTVPLAVSA